MAIATLSAIITKVRKLTLSPNSSNLTDDMIIDYINSFYLFDFPAEFRSLELKNTYTFNTIEGIDTYPFDSDHWQTIQEPVFCAKRQIKLFTDPGQFHYYQFNSLSPVQQREIIAYGDGDPANTTYTATLQNTPILRSINNNPIVTTNTANTQVFPAGYPPTFPGSNISRVQNILITAKVSNGITYNVTDDGAGNFLGAGTGTINYELGTISISFNSVVPDGEPIECQYVPVVLNTPLAILNWQNQLVVRPVPDKGYTIELTGYRTPSQALLGTGTTVDYEGRPELQEWWECIAVGAAKKVYEDRLDMDGIQMMDKMLMERYQTCYTRTYATLGKQRIATIFSDQLNYNYGSGPFGIGNYS